MITLNLLPDALKEDLKSKHTHLIFVNASVVLFVVLTAVTIFILLGRMVLQNQFVNTVMETTLVNKRSSPIAEDVEKINNTIKTVADIQQDFVPWSNLIIDLSQLVPPDVNLRQVSIIQKNNTLKLSGYAATRSAFLEFKDNLTESPIFTTVDSPISNLLKQEDIQFTLDIILDTTKL